MRALDRLVLAAHRRITKRARERRLGTPGIGYPGPSEAVEECLRGGARD